MKNRSKYNVSLHDLANTTIVSEGQAKALKYLLADVPIMGDMIRSADSYRAMTDYLKNRNMSWDDVRYPGIQRGAGVTSGVSSPLMSASFAYLYGSPSRNYVTGKAPKRPPIGYL